MVGRVLAHLQAPLGGSRPMLGLLCTAFAGLLDSRTHPIHALMTGVALRSGLLILLNEGAPLPERTLCAPQLLCLALRGYDGNLPGVAVGLEHGHNLLLPRSLTEEATRRAQPLLNGHQRVLVVRTGSLAEGQAVAAAVAQQLQRRPVFIRSETPAGLAPWLILRQLVPVFCMDLAPGERKLLPEIFCYPGPILVLCGLEGGVEVGSEPAQSWLIPTPPRSEREGLWYAALGNAELAADLARHHRHSSGRIAQLGQRARQQALFHDRTIPLAEDVRVAAWSDDSSGLETLAQPLPDPIPDAALVTTPNLRRDLDLLLLRCRARDGLTEGLGASATARYRPGVRALLVGPSGTGKTLAAGWLATHLGLPLYRVDLAAVTSKYIGETEKNLAQLLARAEQAEVVLLFDEADSLFGKRTDVQQSNDRFANAQTNYLLQRIESYDGIVILTSNSRSRFDGAFTRRLDAIIDFPSPGPEERRALWQSHLGNGHSLTGQEINRLAASTDLAGGHIRNVVLAAAVFAHSEERTIRYHDIIEGLAAEYRKLGKQMPVELRGA